MVAKYKLMTFSIGNVKFHEIRQWEFFVYVVQCLVLLISLYHFLQQLWRV
jgi:hypothetical protein